MYEVGRRALTAVSYGQQAFMKSNTWMGYSLM